jgi:putative radical SAM enzyme (TIGR03279 family)
VLGLTIAYVHEGSIAAELGLETGDIVTSVNGQPLRDLIDFTFACAEDRLSLTVIKKDNVQLECVVEKDLHDDLGISFSQATADGIRRCHNKCCFCFVDQMPKGLRPSLYVKDDDWRLSVLQGNFVTLTNLEPEDIKRLTTEHLSPLYISVHTINGELRKQMMGNPRAAAIREQLTTLAKAGLELHCQIVVCPNFNDGVELKQTVAELAQLYPAVASVAAVPVGLTKFRDHLTPLIPFNKKSALDILKWAQEQQQVFRQHLGCTFFHISDEFYVLTGQEVPPAEYYDGFPQLENGVGLIRQFLDNLTLLPPLMPREKESRIIMITGSAAAKTVQCLANWCNQFPGFNAQVKVATNNFWGSSVTTAGLLTAQDVLSCLQSCLPADYIFLPAAMFSTEGLTLDDWTLAQMEHAAGTALRIASLPEDVWYGLVERSEDHD